MEIQREKQTVAVSCPSKCEAQGDLRAANCYPMPRARVCRRGDRDRRHSLDLAPRFLELVEIAFRHEAPTMISRTNHVASQIKEQSPKREAFLQKNYKNSRMNTR